MSLGEELPLLGLVMPGILKKDVPEKSRAAHLLLFKRADE